MSCQACGAAFGNAHHARRYCDESCKYRARSNREGRKPLGTLADRLWEKVEKTETCWLWTGARISTGYGEIHVEGTMRLAHRIAYELTVGPIPEGLYIDHLCRVRECVNPAHLEPVTNGENVRRGNQARKASA